MMEQDPPNLRAIRQFEEGQRPPTLGELKAATKIIMEELRPLYIMLEKIFPLLESIKREQERPHGLRSGLQKVGQGIREIYRWAMPWKAQ